MFDRKAPSTDDRFPAENFRVYGDALEQFGFVHDERLTESDNRFNYLPLHAHSPAVP
jgi:hypothetical protein